MGWFKATKAAFINNREVWPGDVLQYGGEAGSGLEPMSDADLKKHRARLDAIPPTRSVEQRLDELELAVGLDYIRAAVKRKATEDARRVEDEKRKADAAAKAAQAKADAEAKAQEASAPALAPPQPTEAPPPAAT